MTVLPEIIGLHTETTGCFFKIYCQSSITQPCRNVEHQEPVTVDWVLENRQLILISPLYLSKVLFYSKFTSARHRCFGQLRSRLGSSTLSFLTEGRERGSDREKERKREGKRERERDMPEKKDKEANSIRKIERTRRFATRIIVDDNDDGREVHLLVVSNIFYLCLLITRLTGCEVADYRGIPSMGVESSSSSSVRSELLLILFLLSWPTTTIHHQLSLSSAWYLTHLKCRRHMNWQCIPCRILIRSC